MKHYVRIQQVVYPAKPGEGMAAEWEAACSCGWLSTVQLDPEAARLESCRHLASVMRFGSVTICGDEYLVPRS